MALKKQINSLKHQQAELLSQECDIKKLCAKDAMIKPILLSPDDNAGKKLKKEHFNECTVVTKEKMLEGFEVIV
jgi:hypothetical protein